MKQILITFILLIGCKNQYSSDRDTIAFKRPIEQVEDHIEIVIAYLKSGEISSYGIVTFKKVRRLYLNGQLIIDNLDLYLADPNNLSNNTTEFNNFLESINILSENGITSGSNVRTKVPFFMYKELKDSRVSNLRLIILAETEKEIALFDFLNRTEVLDQKGRLVLLKYIK